MSSSSEYVTAGAVTGVPEAPAGSALEASKTPGNRQERTADSRCSLCPAGCRLRLASTGPDAWRIEYPLDDSSGLCARGGALGELVGHNQRIVSPARRKEGRLGAIDIADCWSEILSRATGRALTFLVDGNIPCEQMIAAASWCENWPQARICFVLEPADEQLLLGMEAGQAEYLSAAQLAHCDGFVIIGDAFAANPRCARSVLDRRRAGPRTPIVVIDPGAGTAWKFATHQVQAGPGTECLALASVMREAGVQTETPGSDAAGEIPSAIEAGRAIARCKRLGVIVAAEYGRAAPWRRTGYLAARLSKALGGGVAPQTVGANALAALRIGRRLGAIGLAEALAGPDDIRIAVGCDVLGMLGWSEPIIQVAASALPNGTTGSAEFVLPVAMTCELDGTFLLESREIVNVAALMPPPAGVGSPADLVASFASRAGAPAPRTAPDSQLAGRRLEIGAPAPATAWQAPPGAILLAGRQADLDGCGALAAHASWQRAMTEMPEFRFAADCAKNMGLKNFTGVKIQAGGQVLEGRIRISPELPDGTVVLPEGLRQVRRMLPSRIDEQAAAIVSEPTSFSCELPT